MSSHGVYPRVCGGTGGRQTLNFGCASWVYPRVCGGTPCQVMPPSQMGIWVYPRVCGGTSWSQVLDSINFQRTRVNRSALIHVSREEFRRRQRSLLEARQGFRCGDCRQPCCRAKPRRPTLCQVRPTKRTTRSTSAFGHSQVNQVPHKCLEQPPALQRRGTRDNGPQRFG